MGTVREDVRISGHTRKQQTNSIIEHGDISGISTKLALIAKQSSPAPHNELTP